MQPPQHGVAQDQHHFLGVDAARRRQSQRADEHDGHDDGEQHHQRGPEAARQLFANGGME